jgi:hypothetical protein
VNEVGLGSLIYGGSQLAHSGRGSHFVAGGKGFRNFFAKRSDTAFRSAITFRAHFGLADALLGRFGVGHDKKMTELKMIERQFRMRGARNLPFFSEVSRKRRKSRQKNRQRKKTIHLQAIFGLFD